MAGGKRARLRTRSARLTPFAYCWYRPTNTALYPHLFSMEERAYPTVTDYGATYTSATDLVTNVPTFLKTLPAGRRCLKLSWLHTYVFRHPDDRCRDAGGIVVGSATPTGMSSYYFKNEVSTTGGAVTGWSNFQLTNVKADVYALGAADAATIAAGGATVDFMSFDAEGRVTDDKINSTYKTALQLDPDWNLLKTRLDAIINEATAGATSSFTIGSWTSDLAHENAWNALQWEKQAEALNQYIAGFQTVFPNCTGSNYEHHGRKAAYVTTTAAGATDLNGHLYYQTAVTGNFSSDYAYGWLNQQESNVLESTNYRSKWLTSASPYHTLIWEAVRSMAAIKSGRELMPWLGFMGFDDSDFALGGYGAAGATDKCPYWEANFALQALMAKGRILYWNSRTYAAGAAPSLNNGGVDQANHLIWDNSDRTDHTRPGITQSFIIQGSTGNDGTYTINYANDGIWYDSGADRTYYRVNETIPSAVSDGEISMDCTDAQDALVDAVLVDLNQQMLHPSVGMTIEQRTIFVGETSTSADSEIVPTGSPIVWASAIQGARRIYCICIGRTSTVKSAWLAQAITGYVNGVSVGTVATVAAGKAYVYYVRPYSASETVTFKWTQAAPTNLIATQVMSDAGTWTTTVGAGGAFTTDAVVVSPIDSSSSYKCNRTSAVATFNVTAGKVYNVSAYCKAFGLTQGTSIYALKGSDDSTIQSITSNTSTQSLVDNWKRLTCTFVAPHGETTCKLLFGSTANSQNAYYCHPMAVQGILPGPIA